MQVRSRDPNGVIDTFANNTIEREFKNENLEDDSDDRFYDDERWMTDKDDLRFIFLMIDVIVLYLYIIM